MMRRTDTKATVGSVEISPFSEENDAKLAEAMNSMSFVAKTSKQKRVPAINCAQVVFGMINLS